MLPRIPENIRPTGNKIVSPAGADGMRAGVKFAVLGYESSQNFGDEIQSIAAARLLPRVDYRIPRERLRDFRCDEKCLLLMNGWFGNGAQFPPAECIVPLYVSFHVARGAERLYTSPEAVAHFKKHSPVGCRDRGTMEILRSAGIDAYYSKCLSLIFPTRGAAAADSIVVVDVAGGRGRRFRRIFRSADKPVLPFSHAHMMDTLGDEFKSQIAGRLLDAYRERAALVVTSRLHCALPCLAMGIPVIYCGPHEYRTAVLSDLGVNMNLRIPEKRGGVFRKFSEKLRFRNFLWRVDAVDVEPEKERLIALVKEKTNHFISRYTSPEV